MYNVYLINLQPSHTHPCSRITTVHSCNLVPLLKIEESDSLRLSRFPFLMPSMPIIPPVPNNSSCYGRHTFFIPTFIHPHIPQQLSQQCYQTLSQLRHHVRKAYMLLKCHVPESYIMSLEFTHCVFNLVISLPLITLVGKSRDPLSFELEKLSLKFS